MRLTTTLAATCLSLPTISVTAETTGAIHESLRLAQAQIQTAPQASAAAKGAADAKEPSSEPLEELVVSGSRITRGGFEAPTPVTALTEEELNLQAPATVSDVLVALPSYSATRSSATSGVRSRTGGVQSADLRNLGTVRTLVLVDGRRFVGADTDGVVDLKQIPMGLIERMEVVTGGASASWGSDAVAGVVNIILKDRIDGVDSTVQYGQSERGDNEEYRVSLAAGTDLFGGAGRLKFGVDYVNSKGIGDQYTRDWGRNEVGLITNGAYATNGLPNFIVADNVRSSVTSSGGVIVSGPLRGTAFGPGGQPYDFNYGQTFGALMIGGSGEGDSFGSGVNLRSPIESINSLAHADIELKDDLTLFVEGSYGWSLVEGNTLPIRDAGNLVIRADNAFLPQSVRDSMAAAGLATINVGRFNRELDVPIHNESEIWRGVVGMKGEISDRWSWDAYYQYGYTTYDARITQNRIQANWSKAIDAVVNPASGQIVCRSTLADPTNGCVPADIFGPDAISPQSMQYFMGRDHRYLLHTSQSVAAASIQGEPFSLWAGDVSVAFGAEYRTEKADAESDELSQQVQLNGLRGAYQYGNQQPIDGEYDVYEFFGEATAPLVRDASWARSLELNGAFRRTHYSTSGWVSTWKGGLTYAPTDDLRFRVTRSRDIRAPNLTELFESGGSIFFSIFNPVLNTSTLVPQISEGNLSLEPEEADSWTGGVVYQPSWAAGLKLAIDYFDISLDGVIATQSPTLIAERCFAGDAAACDYVRFDSGGGIVSMRRQFENLNQLETSGVDIEASYRFDLDALSSRLRGDIAIRSLATYVNDLETTDAVQTIDDAGGGNVPHWKINTDITYSIDSVSLNLRGRYVDSVLFNVRREQGTGTVNSINDNTIPSMFYLDLSARYDFAMPGTASAQFFFAVDNVFDTDPPDAPVMFPAGAFGSPSTNAVLYDVIGRTYRAGLRMRF